MCGIVGYVGVKQAAPILLSGLSKLEYRGYDSAGLAVRDEANEHIEVVKAKGRLKNLMEMTDSGNAVHGLCGIGHTRWATHGEPNTVNAHPQYTREKRVVIVHNGIIENYQEIKESLLKKGYTFASQTDTEVAAALLDSYYAEAAKRESDPRARALDAIRNTMIRVRGSYALGILFGDQPGVIYAARKDSPLILGRCDGEYQGHMIASDVPAVLNYTRSVVYIDNQEIACLTRDELHVYNIDCEEIEKPFVEIKWDAAAAEKDGYEHFMMKEIHEQPEVLKKTILPRLTKGLPDLSDEKIPDELLKRITNIRVIACGTAMHAGMVARALIEPRLRIPVTVSIASEFRYEEPLIDDSTLTIVISQSGETIDTLAALRLARECGSTVISVVNVKGSTIARESDYVIYTHGGPEIAVASTKAYTVQIAALYLLFCRMALVRGVYTEEHAEQFMSDLLNCASAMETMIRDENTINEIVTHIVNYPDVFFIGRGMDYAFSLEGALKLKEISYIHAEAYAAGELKHGTIALITDHVPVIAIATQKHIFAKTISNIREVKARGAYVVLLVTEDTAVDEGIADVIIRIPKEDDKFTVFPIAVVLQLIAYYASVQKGLDVDQPRNLAKSVTVE